MEAQLTAFDRHRDHRAPFLRVYTRMTSKVRDRLQEGYFSDPAWLERVGIRFAAYYFAALDAHQAGQECPPAWRRAFVGAEGGRTFVLEDVLLGMNAHINNDLPQVMADILGAEGDWPDYARMERRHFDHDQINRTLQDLVPVVEGDIGNHYARLLRVLGRWTGDLDLLLVRHWIEQDALVIARRIDSASPRWLRWTAPILRWWRLL